MYLKDTGVDTADFVVSTLDLCYPKFDREETDVFAKLEKYKEGKRIYSSFVNVVKGMVGNGDK